jgi:acetate kinase
MTDAIIVLNAGSSSLKFCIYDVGQPELELVARGQIEGLGTSPRFKVKNKQGEIIADAPVLSPSGKVGHTEAFAHLADWARENYAGAYRLIAVGHRVVHGGPKFSEPTLITTDVMRELEQIVPLAPLHQPHNLAGIKAVSQLRPDLSQVACFDTAFHRNRPSVSERFGLPNDLFEQGVRRWGFHGLSYQFISSQLQKIAPKLREGRVIVAHIGSGASMCALRNGRSIDTTMGFTALDGLPMGTRCGYLDPGVILFLLSRGMTASQIESLLYKKSGLLGISGVSNDVRDLLASKEPLAAEALDYFVYRIVREIGALTAVLGGLDGLIFTAGVGENSPAIRQRICSTLGWLSIRIDESANQRGRGCISPPGASPQVWVIPTDEESVIAVQTLEVSKSAEANRELAFTAT